MLVTSILPSAFTKHQDLSLPGAACVLVCVRVFRGKGGNGRGQTVLCTCILAVCVNDFMTLCSWMKGRCKYVELEQQPWYLAIYTCTICFCLRSLFPRPYCTFSSLSCSGRGLGMRVVVLTSLFKPHCIEDHSFALGALAVLSVSILWGNLVPVSIHKDGLPLNEVGLNLAEQTIDNCSGMKRVEANCLNEIWLIEVTASACGLCAM